MSCFLEGYDHSCNWPIFQHHHMVNKSVLRNAEARRYAEKVRPDIFIARLCQNANFTRLADTKGARAFMWQKKVDRFGYEEVDGALEALRSCFKTPMLELRLDALLALETQTRIGDKSGGARNAA
jgi:hypothetical protein